MFKTKVKFFWVVFVCIVGAICAIIFLQKYSNGKSLSALFGGQFWGAAGSPAPNKSSDPKGKVIAEFKDTVETRTVPNFSSKNSLRDRYALPYDAPIEKLVGREISKASDEHYRKQKLLFENEQLRKSHDALLLKAQGGDPEAMWELSNILSLCDSALWRGGKDAPRLAQCGGVPENSELEAIRWLALAAREGNLLARNRLLYLTGGSARGAEYSALLASDPSVNGLVQQEILASLQFFTAIPAGGYLQQGKNIYLDGVVPININLAAAYSVAAYTLQASRFPNAESTMHLGGINADMISSLSEAQRLNAFAKATEILKVCCDGIPPATSFAKSGKF